MNREDELEDTEGGEEAFPLAATEAAGAGGAAVE